MGWIERDYGVNILLVAKEILNFTQSLKGRVRKFYFIVSRGRIAVRSRRRAKITKMDERSRQRDGASCVVTDFKVYQKGELMLIPHQLHVEVKVTDPPPREEC
jgi:hypothetical protein